MLLMLSSDKSGDVVAAASAISKLLRANNLDWHDLAARIIEPPKREIVYVEQPRDDEAWRETLEACQRHANRLRSREREFLMSLEDWVGELTDRQSDWLAGIHNRLQRRYGANF